MKLLAPDVHQLSLFPFDSINAYVIGDVLVDAGVRWSAGHLLRVLDAVPIQAHALTHAHADHQGASRAVCEALDVPLWCGAGDAAAMESGQIVEQYPDPDHWIARLQRRFWAGPARPVDRRLEEGDTVAGFEVLETPGHSPGHVSFYRPEDGVLILGDVLLNMNLLTTREGLREPPAVFTPNPAENRRSAKRLGALRPSLVCFGHGPPLRDPDRFAHFCRQL
jgi:glyoxylase-like metal-dependent hydrolase (beta-lactamase superfamily II)